MKYVISLNAWAINMYEKFCKTDANKICYTKFRYANKYFVYNAQTEVMGIAKCHPKDEDISAVGYGLAYARCIGVQIPKEVPEVPIGSLPTGAAFVRFASELSDVSMDICYVVGNLPTNKKLTCFCDEDIVYTIDSDTTVFQLK